MSNVVLVIDMVRGFMEPGHNLYCGDDSREIIPNVIQLLRRERDAGAQVLFVSDHHDPDDLEFQIFPVHCVKGTEEPEVIPELAEFLTGSNVIPKNRYSGFFNTGLAQRLASLAPDKLILCGVCTDICVLPHHRRRPKPRLPGGGALGLRGKLRFRGPHLGPEPSQEIF